MRRRVPSIPVRRTWSWRDYFVVADKLSVAPSTREGTLAIPMGAGNALQWEVTVHSSNGSNVNLAVQGSMEKENWVGLPPTTLGLIEGYWSGQITSIPWPWVSNNDIVVVSLFASRVHARVEAREGHFVLVDLSSNGTFVLLDAPDEENTAELRLRQEEMVLTGRGWLGMGRSASRHGDHSVRFMLQAG